jgi:tetratricopeptide (TPR) repeat protein
MSSDSSADSDRRFDNAFRSAETVDPVAEAHLLHSIEHELFGAAQEPTRLGRFTILERVGRGGFGSVYAAYDPQLDRRVAIKVLRRRADDGEARAALLNEAQALARIRHPHVVTVFDAQLAGDDAAATVAGAGQLFLVAEFLSGPSLREWSVGSSHGWRTVLDVYTKLGRGLAAAHEQGIVHRDFKPANALFDANGEPRVVDFGLAVLSDERSSATAGSGSSPGSGAGTPRYMAPEQMGGGLADARADQFAFCVALYEALYGEPPHADDDADTLQAAKASGPREPTARRVPAPVHAAIVRGLAPDPDQRFPSMQALLSALDRDPARARRRVLALCGVLGLGALAVVAIDPSRRGQVGHCQTDASTWDSIWDAERAVAVQSAFVDTGHGDALGASDRIRAAVEAFVGRWESVREQTCRATPAELDAGARAERTLCLERQRRHVGGLTRVLTTADLGTVRRAASIAQGLPEPLDCQRDRHGPRAGAADEVALEVASRVAAARTLLAAARIEEAEKAISEGVQYSGTHDFGEGVAALLQLKSLLRATQSRFEESVELAVQAMAAADEAGAPDVWIRAGLTMARSLASLGRPDEARRIADLVVGRVARGHGGTFEEAQAHLAVGNAQRGQGDIDGAITSLVEALRLAQESRGANGYAVADFHNELGNAYSHSRNHDDEALAEYRRAVEIWRGTIGAEHVNLAHGLNNVANSLAKLDDPEGAMAAYAEATRIAESWFDDDHVLLAILRQNIGVLDSAAGRLMEAEAGYREALRIRRAILPGCSAETGGLIANLGIVEGRRGRTAEADRHLVEAIECFDPETHAWMRGTALVARAEVALIEGRLDDALSLAREGGTGLGTQHLSVLGVQLRVALARDQDGDARALADRIYASVSQGGGPEVGDVTLPYVAEAWRRAGDGAQARDVIAALREKTSARYGSAHRNLQALDLVAARIDGNRTTARSALAAARAPDGDAYAAAALGAWLDVER